MPMSAASRSQCVSALLSLSAPLADIQTQLLEFPWDCSDQPQALTKEHLGSVLARFASGALTAEQVEAWANAVEMREDVDYDGGTLEGMLLHSLANSTLDGPLSPAKARRMISRLGFPTPNLGVGI